MSLRGPAPQALRRGRRQSLRMGLDQGAKNGPISGIPSGATKRSRGRLEDVPAPPFFSPKKVPNWEGGLSIKATVFAKLWTLNVREVFKWFLRNQPCYRHVENLKHFVKSALHWDIQK